MISNVIASLALALSAVSLGWQIVVHRRTTKQQEQAAYEQSPRLLVSCCYSSSIHSVHPGLSIHLKNHGRVPVEDPRISLRILPVRDLIKTNQGTTVLEPEHSVGTITFEDLCSEILPGDDFTWYVWADPNGAIQFPESLLPAFRAELCVTSRGRVVAHLSNDSGLNSAMESLGRYQRQTVSPESVNPDLRHVVAKHIPSADELRIKG